MNGKSKIWAVALLASVLLLGGALGAVVDRSLAGEPGCLAREARRDDHGARHRGYLARLAAELDLTAEQQAQVSTTVERHREKVSALWREMRPQFEQMKSDLRRDIREVLNEEQREKYEQLLESEAQRRHEQRGRD